MDRDTLCHILDLARWAPSGDNTQPWRFELVDDQSIRVHGFDTRDHILYDFDGHASHLAHGALLQTIAIAATRFGLQASWSSRSDVDQRHPIYDVRLKPLNAGAMADPRCSVIETRCVQRRPMRTTPLTAAQKAALSDAVGSEYSVQWFESGSERLEVARLLFRSARIRLVCPEAYTVHRDIIEWRARYSKDRIPEQAVGVDPMTARLMQWVMQSWGRVQFFNRFLMGTVVPRIQLDFLPGWLCAAHVLIRPAIAPSSLHDWVTLGAAWQRLWLTAASHGLLFQPEMTPVIFRWYARSGRRFSAESALFYEAIDVAERFERLAGAHTDAPFGVFGRLGAGPTPNSRSVRLGLDELWVSG